jgi:hypothetical protein
MAWAAMLVCALASGACAAQEAGPQSIVVTGQRSTSPWVRVESAHFVVVSDAARADVARLVEHLERLDALLRMFTADHGGPAAGPEPKLNLMYLQDSHQLDRVAPDRPFAGIGLFRDCAGGAQGFLVHTEALPEVADDRLATAPLHEGLSYVSQAYARHFLYRHTDVRRPSAWIEGFADYFASVTFGTKQMVIGRIPPGVRAYLDYHDKGHEYYLDYNRMLSPDPYKDLYETKVKAARVEYQARAWILAHYILGADERRKGLATFVKAVDQGTDPAAAMRDAFGLDVADASKVLWRYQRQGTNSMRVDMPWDARPAMTINTMSATSGEFVLADTVLQACPTRAQGEALLRTLGTDAAKVPNVGAAQLALSRAQVGWGDPATALPWLQRAAREADASADVLTLLARADLKLAARADGDARTAYLDEAYALLARARTRDPRSGPVALAGLDFALLTGDAPGSAPLDRVTAAWQAARDSGPLARAAALAWCYLGDVPKATHVLRMLASDTRDPAMAAWAVQFQRRVDAGLTKAAILDEMRKGSGDGLLAGGGNEWTFDMVALVKEVEAQASEEYARGAIQRKALKEMASDAAVTRFSPNGPPPPPPKPDTRE